MNPHFSSGGPAPGWAGDGSGGPGEAGDRDGPAPIAAPSEPPGHASPRRSGLNPWAAGAGALAVVVAVAVAALAMAKAGSYLNAVLVLIVAGMAVAELLARTRGSAAGRAGEGRPLPLIRGPAGSGARAAAIAGVAIIVVIGAIMGLLSWFAILEADRCYTDRCNAVTGFGWLVLMVSQVLIFWTALLGAGYARSTAQLARAVILGLAGPVAAFAVFGAAISGVPR